MQVWVQLPERELCILPPDQVQDGDSFRISTSGRLPREGPQSFQPRKPNGSLNSLVARSSDQTRARVLSRLSGSHYLSRDHSSCPEISSNPLAQEHAYIRNEPTGSLDPRAGTCAGTHASRERLAARLLPSLLPDTLITVPMTQLTASS